MTILKEAELYAGSQFISKVNIYKEEEENLLTVIPKSSQHILLFSNDDILTIQYKEKQFIYHLEITFEELKIIKKKHYYVFNIMKTSVSQNSQKTIDYDEEALFSNIDEYGYATITFLEETQIHIESIKPISGRLIDIFYTQNNKKKQTKGKIIWRKTILNKHCYGVLFL